MVERLFRYCYCCGGDVSTYTVPIEGGMEIRCTACGLPLEREVHQEIPTLDSILIADDDRFFRELLSNLLEEGGVARSVIPCESGMEFLSKAAERLHEGLPIRLAILDILMAPLDGTATAFALRAMERGMKAPSTPILFLSALRADDDLRRIIARCQPALYLNKAVEATPDKLAPRLEKVIMYLLQT